jgi:cytochrome b561
MSTKITYDSTAKGFHWLIVALLIAQYTVGSIMPHIGRHTQDTGWVHWHLMIGAIILVVMALRLLWRIKGPIPRPDTEVTWERKLATFTHWMLYALVIGLALLGWAAANARGWEVKLFNVIPLPALSPKGTAWGHTAGDIHDVVIYVLLGFIALHLAGVLKHKFIDRSNVLRRMLPGGNA